MTVDFETWKRRSGDDPNKVRCARCGAWIFARANRCPKCGVHFDGEAFQFSHEPSDELIAEKPARRRRALVIAIILAIGLVVGVALYFAR